MVFLFLTPRSQVVWVSVRLKQLKLWLQVTEKKGKLLKWIEGSMEAETGMANNPFLVALHNALSQKTRERKRTTVLVEQKNKYKW